MDWNEHTNKQGLDKVKLDISKTVVDNATVLVGDNETTIDGSMRLVLPAVFAGEEFAGKFADGVVKVGDLPQDCVVTKGIAVVTGKYDKAVTFDIGTEEDPKQFVDGFDGSQPVRTAAQKACLIYYPKPTQVIATVSGAGAQLIGEVVVIIEYKRLTDYAMTPSN